jgi:16S rRNA (cytidine1402-2'-O)-methyltransferase
MNQNAKIQKFRAVLNSDFLFIFNKKSMCGKVYLIPNTLGDSRPGDVIPAGVIEILHSLDHFIVENIRNARRFLVKTGYPRTIDNIIFFELNKHTPESDIPGFLFPCEQGKDIGLLSEAGVPAIADPGAAIVEIAHRKGIRVVPLTGPSSILMALMASGFNGQSFSFRGYLPVDKQELSTALKDLEARSKRENQTQIFIETPYRNMRLLEEILSVCKPGTKLCIAKNLTTDAESIEVRSIGEWKKSKTDLDKQPAVFLIQA